MLLLFKIKENHESINIIKWRIWIWNIFFLKFTLSEKYSDFGSKSLFKILNFELELTRENI